MDNAQRREPVQLRSHSVTSFLSLILLLLLAESAHAQLYHAVILPRPAAFSYVYGEGVASGKQVGYGIPANGSAPYDLRALLWTGTQSPQDITPSGFRSARVEDAEGDQIVGVADGQAALWQNGGSVVVLLHPPAYTLSEALGVGGGQQAGYVSFGFTCAECRRDMLEHAALWQGSQESLMLLHALGFHASRALDTDGIQQVGWGFRNATSGAPYHALLWQSNAQSVVDLHPGTGFDYSFAVSVGDGEQAGYGWGPTTDDYSHALLWRGSAQSVMDLNPPDFSFSAVHAVRGGVQVGSGARWSDAHNSALAWRGTPESVIDLHALLPEGYRLMDSLATDIDTNGDIIGTATEDATGETVAVVWKRANKLRTMNIHRGR